MSELDILDDAVERLEWDERKEEDTPVKRWRQLTSCKRQASQRKLSIHARSHLWMKILFFHQ